MEQRKNTLDLSGKNPIEITWTAPEFEFESKDVSWYWLSIIAATILFLVSVWQKNFLFSLFVIIGECMVLHWARQHPKNIEFKISKNGVAIGTIEFHEYKHLAGFHILEKDEWGELVLKTKKRLHPYIKILIFQDDVESIRKFLKNHLEEIEYQDSLSDGISRLIGF